MNVPTKTRISLLTVLGAITAGVLTLLTMSLAKPHQPDPLASPFVSGTLPAQLTQASGISLLDGLKGDQLMFIGDKDLSISLISDATHCFNTGNFAGHVQDLGPHLKSPPLVNDMEDVAWDAQKRTAFVLVSGSKSSKDHVKAEREKLLRLHFDEASGEWGVKEVDHFKNKLIAAFPHLHELAASPQIPAAVGGVAGTFNMEGLALLPGGKLLFGFRSPTHPRNATHPADPGDALVVTLNNPHKVFDSVGTPKFAATPQFLNFRGQGIRGMFYDAQSRGCWIVSGRSANGKSADTQGWSLWFWNLKDPPVEKNIPHGQLKNAEGVCRMNFRGQPGLLLVEDAGAASKKDDPNQTAFPCRYLLIPMPTP